MNGKMSFQIDSLPFPKAFEAWKYDRQQDSLFQKNTSIEIKLK